MRAGQVDVAVHQAGDIVQQVSERLGERRGRQRDPRDVVPVADGRTVVQVTGDDRRAAGPGGLRRDDHVAALGVDPPRAGGGLLRDLADPRGGGAQLLGGAHDSPPVCASAAACSAASASGSYTSPSTTSAACRPRRLSASTAARSCSRRYSALVGTHLVSWWIAVFSHIRSSHSVHGESEKVAVLETALAFMTSSRDMTTTREVEPSFMTA